MRRALSALFEWFGVFFIFYFSFGADIYFRLGGERLPGKQEGRNRGRKGGGGGPRARGAAGPGLEEVN